MSDFDREAERERLREQFERDKAKREQSERMSELLLKGATMTNKHCDNCGDPVFRHDGQEFCPTCQAAAVQQSESAADRRPADETPDGKATEADGSPTDTAAEQNVDPNATDGNVGQSPKTARSSDGSTPEPERQPASQPRQPQQPTDQPPHPQQPTNQPRQPSTDGELGEARESLVRSLTALARKAESADDLSRKREYLAAAKEAAAALDAAERVDR